jgi:hypothetical protein
VLAELTLLVDPPSKLLILWPLLRHVAVTGALFVSDEAVEHLLPVECVWIPLETERVETLAAIKR